MKRSNKSGFTLAEVLITLGIIGVVAALTIPTLISNYKNRIIETRLQKAYSELSQMIELSEAKNESVANWDYSLNALDFFNTYLKEYINTVKICNLNQNSCTANVILRDAYDSRLQFATASGYSVYISIKNNYYKQKSVGFVIDLNGLKAPNLAGIDIFYFWLFPDNISANGPYKNLGHDNMALYVKSAGIYADGYNIPYNILTNIARGCAKNIPTSTRAYCTYVIMKNNWKIPTRAEYKEMGGLDNGYPW